MAMKIALLLHVLLGVAVNVKAQDGNTMVNCFSSTDCSSGNNEVATLDNCCQHSQQPFGLSYTTIDGNGQCNACPVEFGFRQPSFRAAERTEPHTVEVAFFSGTTSRNFEIEFTATPGTAIEPSDFRLTSRRLTVRPANEEQQNSSFGILFNNDRLAQEGIETFTLRFDFRPGVLGQNPTVRDTLSGVIVDATPIAFQFSEEDYRGVEGEEFIEVIITKSSEIFLINPITFIVIPQTVDQAQELIPSVITVPNDAVFSPNRADVRDFDTATQTAVFRADNVEAGNAETDLSVLIRIVNDTVDEADEQFFIVELQVVNAADQNLILLQRRASRCIIIDNDPLLVGFKLNQYTFYEPVVGNVRISNVTVIKENNGLSEQTFGLQFTFGEPVGLQDINLATLQMEDPQVPFDFVGSDPGDRTTLLAFGPTETEITISFTIFSDLLAEGTEAFGITLSSQGSQQDPPFPTVALSGSTQSPFPTTDITIIDAEIAVVGFEELSYTFTEDEELTEVCIVIRNMSVLFDIRMSLVTMAITADGTDFLEFTPRFPEIVIIAEGSIRSCARIDIFQDDILEDQESFNVTFSLAQGTTGVIIDEPVTQVFILDATRVTIGFEQTLYSTNEGTTVEVCTRIRNGDIRRNVEVEVFSIEGTAAADDDFVPVNLPLIFTPTENRRCFSVIVNDDDILENAENFTLVLTSDDSVVILDPDMAVVNISDTNSIVVALEQTEFSVIEADGAFIEVCAVITSATTLGRDAVVTLQSADGTAQSSGDIDFVALNSALVFRPGDTNICRNISVINDDFYENSENFEVSLSTTDSSVTIDPTRQRGNAIIEDTDEIVIGFVRETDSVAENTPGFINICVVVLSGMLGRSATVRVMTANAGDNLGHATAGEDYTSSSNDFTFTNVNRDTPQCLRVQIIDDITVEGVEFFFGLLSNRDSIPRLILDPQRTNITIIDTDSLTVGFVNVPYSELENNGPATVSVEVRGEFVNAIQVRLTTEPSGDTNEAIADTDYSSVNAVITFNQGDRVLPAGIPLIDDNFVEGDETLRVRIEVLTTGNIELFSPDTELVTIVDDDRVVIGLEETMVSVNENVGTRELCARIISGSILRDVLVNVVYESRNALDGEDYRSDPRVLTFSPGVDRVCFNVSIIDDTRYELDEDFFVNITTTDPQAEINPMTTLVTILDDEILTIGWEFPEYSVAEADGEVEVCAVVRSGTTQAITLPRINILPIGDSATAPGDYDDRSDPRFFDFQPGSPTRMCTRITITMDGILEPTESFFADLADLPTQRVVYDPQRTRIIVSDNDDATIGFRPDTYTVNEGDGFVDIVVEVLDGTVATDVVVRLTTSDGSATSVAPADYGNPGEVLLTFNSGVSSVATRVTIENDQIAENPEEFFGNLQRVTDIDRVSVAPNAASITINDNDVPMIGFERTQYFAVENNSVTTEVCAVVMMPPALDRMVSVVVTTTDGTAQAPMDYTSLMMTLVFSPGNGRQCVQIDAREDGLTEDLESLTASLSSTDNVDLSPDEATISIMDGNIVRIGFELPSYTFNESDGTGTIQVIKTGVSSDPIRVSVTGGPSSQTDVVVSAEGIDQEIEFSAGGSNIDSISVSFRINDDDTGLEAVEMYLTSLEITSSVGNVQLRDPDMTLINILDDDIVNVGFGRPNVTVPEEDGEFRMCVTKDRLTLMDVTVTITSSQGTATSGVDYTPENVPSTVTIPGSSLNMCFVSPSIEDDDLPEPDETFTLEISSTDPNDPGIVVGNPTTMVIIVDTDVVTVRFEQPTYTVREDAGRAEVCLIKTPSTLGTVTINNVQSVNTGSALAGVDYTAVRVSVTFGPGAGDRQCIMIPISFDTISEPTESFDVILDLPGPAVVPGNPDTAMVFIEDIGTEIEVNDTVIGDPLFTVPILVPEEQLAALNLTRLTMCYEIHGGSDQWFNLVTDECTSVNARYDDINEDLNIIDAIGIRTVDSADRCLNIGVNVEQCAAQINGVAMDRYSRDGVSVRRYGNRRVRISVPNCNDLALVIWVICEERVLDDPFQPGLTITAEMIKFVVLRGLNTGHRPAHGLLGQFWNIPVSVARFTGPFRQGVEPDTRLVLNLTTPGSQPRSFTGWLYDLTWELEVTPCLYVGSRQAGSIYEVTNPNDEVIAEFYTEYRVESAFSEENYRFGMFDESNCALGPVV